MKKKKSPVKEERVYRAYLDAKRQEEQQKIRDVVLKRLYGSMPASQEIASVMETDEFQRAFEEEVNACSDELSYLELPLEQQTLNIQEEYNAMRLLIANDLIQGYDNRTMNRYRTILQRQDQKAARNAAPEDSLDAAWKANKERFLNDLFVTIDDGFTHRKLHVKAPSSSPYGNTRLNADNFELFFLPGSIQKNIQIFLVGMREETLKTTLQYTLIYWLNRHVSSFRGAGRKKQLSMKRHLKKGTIPQEMETALMKRYTPEAVASLVENNRSFRKAKLAYDRQMEREAAIRATILEKIPERYIDMFPLARSIHRRFFIHVGPTNSGKTYDAIHALCNSRSGVYLGPLRLLAYEQYENIRSISGACNLLTGEEEIREHSPFTASTIEMLNTARHYACAVIDEGQMIGDRARGGAWSNAMYGLCSDEIHVCTAPEALNLLIRIIEDCGDEYTVVPHTRFTPLILEETPFAPDFSDVRKGDALVVFSRRDVHAVASALQRLNHTVSIIYGALPYDVRHREAEKFAEGETDIVVATDAIGMGMNLPIRRIVFLEQHKFDGYSQRKLTSSEVLQIAGRAGRRGLYDTGYVAVTGRLRQFRTIFNNPPEEIEKAYIAFPDILLTLDCSLSEALERWKNTEVHPDLLKGDIDEMILLAKAAEKHLHDKDLIYRLVSIPFDVRVPELWNTWMDCVEKEARGIHCDLFGYLEHGRYVSRNSDIAILELEYKRMDLLYGYSRQISENAQDMEEISEIRKNISKAIMDQLSSQKLTPKRCKRCGRQLAWNYPYGICSSCFYRNRY